MNERVIVKEYVLKALENRTRLVRVILPIDYYSSDNSYPVLYMHDGQNLLGRSPFSGYSWNVLNTMDKLNDLTNGFIIVGIDNGESKRILEYSPFIPKSMYKYLNKKAGVPNEEIRPEANFYGEFIVNQLKPTIDKEYRTLTEKEHTFIAGSSCGGLISIYLGLKYQDIFSVIGAFSPAFQFIPTIKGYVNKRNINGKMRIYHDMGGKEYGLRSFILVRQQKIFNTSLLEKMSENRVLMILDKPAKHNEYYWAIRFEKFIKFIFTIG